MKDKLFASLLLSVVCLPVLAQEQPFRPPAVPLVVHDPYFSVWTMADRLTGEATRHWTGKPNTLTSLVRVDGKTFRLMGPGAHIPALDQTRVEVLPTRTIYDFRGAGIMLQLKFFTPALPSDLDVLSRPLTYISWDVASVDGAAHEVSVYFDASSDLAADNSRQETVAARYQLDGMPVLRTGTASQAILAKQGDDLRIDWGYLYAAADRAEAVTAAAVSREAARKSFAATGRISDTDDFSDHSSAAGRRDDVLAFSVNLGSVRHDLVSRYVMLAYDDLYSIEFFHRQERPWWRRNGAEAADLLRAGRRDHDALLVRAENFDRQLMADLRSVGGEKYARLAALAYRQAIGAHKLVADIDGTPMLFPKENYSNGCISTVDVIYPSAPFTLLFNPQLLKAQLYPVLEYARMARWKWPFAPHDLGTYPLADGQVYGGGERTADDQMPVEESGNMLILLAALAKVEGNADYAARYWPQISQWAAYLKEKGLDPENQLSTDDFAGHLAHNANLSIKAILALGSYGLLADMTGRKQEASDYRQTAENFAREWIMMAADGDHYRLAFDKPGTWSQKYNLVWDRILGLNLFPPEVARKEIAFYKSRQNEYGLPLDNRRSYTKLDWILWTATLAENPADFEALAGPAYRFADKSPSRVPLTDWYDTITAKQEGFQARSVVGGLFIKMLANPELWKKYSSSR